MSVGEAGAAHPDVLQQAEVLHLVTAALLLKQQRGLNIVGFDAADVVRLLQGETESEQYIIETISGDDAHS